MRTFNSLSALAITIILVAAPTETAFAQKATTGQKVDIGTCRQLAREKCRFQKGMGACHRAAVARCKQGGAARYKGENAVGLAARSGLGSLGAGCNSTD